MRVGAGSIVGDDGNVGGVYCLPVGGREVEKVERRKGEISPVGKRESEHDAEDVCEEKMDGEDRGYGRKRVGPGAKTACSDETSSEKNIQLCLGYKEWPRSSRKRS